MGLVDYPASIGAGVLREGITRMKPSLIRSVLAVLFISATAHAQCPGDVNNNGVVNGTDLAAILSAWGTNGQDEGGADLNDDGIVNGQDLAGVLGGWGPCLTGPDWATVIEVAPDPAIVTSPTLRAAISATGLPWRVRDTATQIEMLLIPPGGFVMGCNYCG
jgi:hypothetical protein